MYIIKNFDAETVPATTGPKPKIPNALASTIISKASDGTYESLPKTRIWLESKFHIKLSELTISQFLIKRGYPARKRRHVIKLDGEIARERLM